MFSNKQTKKIDMSFLKYLTDVELTTTQVTMNQVKKDFPHTKNSSLESCRMFYMLNYQYLDEEQKEELLSKIHILQGQEEQKFQQTFEKCQLTEIK